MLVQVQVQVLERELVQVLERGQALVSEQALEPVRVLGQEQEPGLVPHRQRQSCSQLPPVLV